MLFGVIFVQFRTFRNNDTSPALLLAGFCKIRYVNANNRTLVTNSVWHDVAHNRYRATPIRPHLGEELNKTDFHGPHIYTDRDNSLSLRLEGAAFRATIQRLPPLYHTTRHDVYRYGRYPHTIQRHRHPDNQYRYYDCRLHSRLVYRHNRCSNVAYPPTNRNQPRT